MQWSRIAGLLVVFGAAASTACERISGLSGLHADDDLGSDAGGLPPPCSPMSTDAFRDDFDDGKIGPEWKYDVAVNDVVFVEADGELMGKIGMTSATPQLGGLVSVDLYDFRNCHVTVKVTEVPRGRGAGGLLVMGATPWTARLEFNYHAGALGFISYDENANPTNIGNATYEAANDVWWRIAEHDGTALFQTSNGGPFVTRAPPAMLPFDPSEARIALFVETVEQNTLPAGEIRFDDLNRMP